MIMIILGLIILVSVFGTIDIMKQINKLPNED